jgi:pimeloyl-ACP methyl ester carboxylesterase
VSTEAEAPPSRERFTLNDGLKVRYLDNDPPRPEGLPIVFVPGVTDFADEYAAALEFVAPRRLVVVEMRGRGGSDAPPTGYSVPEQASDVEAVIADTLIGRFHLMTFSRGTTPAIEVALADPGRVASLSIGDYLAAEIALPLQWVDSQWASRWRGRPMPERVQRHVLEQIAGAARARDLWEDVAGLGIPVLVARGDSGGILTDAPVERYRRAIPGVEVVEISGSGHDLFRPDRLAYPAAVLEFIGRRTPEV